jgi:two-component system response regulator YesN
MDTPNNDIRRPVSGVKLLKRTYASTAPALMDEREPATFQSRPDTACDSNELSVHVKRIIQFVKNNLSHEGLCVKSIRAHCHLHDNNISSRFRLEVGVTISEFINKARLDLATRLLKDESISVWNVSYIVGYSHIQTFYRAFERQFRCTPGDYRRRQM